MRAAWWTLTALAVLATAVSVAGWSYFILTGSAWRWWGLAHASRGAQARIT